MTSPDPLRDPLSALVDTARAFDRAAETRGSHSAAPESLALLQEALQSLSTGWYRLAADAGRSTSRGDLSRERDVRLIGTLHDVAAAFARCARACREGHSTITEGVDDEPSWFAGRRPTTRAPERALQ